MSEHPILIVGGGLGGLSLAQGLKQSEIAFKIFERDAAASFRAQGYRIRIGQQGGDSLRKLLPPYLFDIFERTSAPVIPGGHGYDAITGASTGPAGGPPRTGKAWNIDRTVLRNVLLRGLEEDISFSKKLDRYELKDDGVVAHFVDGTSTTGRQIIGVDGIRSMVRKQLLPCGYLLDTEGRAVFGKTLIGNGKPTQIEIKDGLTLIKDTSTKAQASLFCDVMRFDHTVDVGLDMPEDYIYWVLVFQKARTEISDRELLAYDGVQSAQLAEVITRSWHGDHRAIVSNQKPKASSTLALQMLSPNAQRWTSDARVTLLGDAAHPMPPIGGVGANAAFEDAAELLEVLKGNVTNAVIGEYERIILDRTSKTLPMIAGGACHFFGMKPVDQLEASVL